jgi:UPF0755 protein
VKPAAARTTAAVVLLLLVSGALVAYGWQQYQRFLLQPLDVGAEGTIFNVDPGMSGRAVIAGLAGQGCTRNSWQWRVLLRVEPTVFRSGEYLLEPGLKPQGLLRKLARGDVIHYRFTIVEGWTYRQLIGGLLADPVLGPPFKASMSEPGWQDPPTPWPQPEGAFLPETYVFSRSESAMEVLEQAQQAMQAALADAWARRADDHPARSPYELLILASIIEKETALDQERARISGVFVRRLKLGMRLQTDPTVIYGLGESFDGNIRRRDLTADTPYNTYTRSGLPPTPIALPGRASLLAAAQPAPGSELYFVADGHGGHTFSDTLAQHRAAVNSLLGKK